MIYITPMSRLNEVVGQSGATHLITLLTAGNEFVCPPEIPASQHLHLTMHDISEPREDLSPPDREQVRDLLEFACKWERRSPLVINCFAGISRSTAAAYIVWCALLPDRDEDDLAGLLREKSPSATPNSLIVSLGDELLARQGRMARAIKSIGRGADAFEGTPFCLDL